MKTIAQKLFPEGELSIESLEKRYPPRNLAAGAAVTRVAPSPTGFIHIGGIFAALISERFSHQQNGIFYLRIEDTDKKREVEGAVGLIVTALQKYGIKIDEGEIELEKETGDYGPYRQSQRADIYQAVARRLIEKGLAYPCFCSPEELEEISKKQGIEKTRPGYYGKWAKCRDMKQEDIIRSIEKGRPFTVRFRSSGDFNNKITVNDLIKEKKILPENDLDVILLKSDRLPTYHFAHVVDDHFMRTTHVLRGDEWFSSLPLHLQLFEAVGWAAPLYGHISPIQKTDGASRRKLSKRKDPEANVDYYEKDGYLTSAIIEYLLNLANSDFEDWRAKNPDADNHKFVLRLEKINQSGALFDLAKLQNISKAIIARMSAGKIAEAALQWARKYDTDLAKEMAKDSGYLEKIFSIERSGEHQRKDIAKWSDLRSEIGYFFDPIFEQEAIAWPKLMPDTGPAEVKAVLEKFLQSYDVANNQEQWFGKIKDMAVDLGYASDLKTFKQSPDKYKGYVADVAKILRVFLTGKTQTPNLYEIMQVMGEKMVVARLKKSLKSL
ncbi:MAG: glutamate--tRNA ligase [Candidatus Pacebacteria bacterium]|nr:glutamate--tRNA ligase [Candidatus Paceibacterota bacterium]